MAKHQTKLLIAKHSSGRMIDIADAKNGLQCDCTCVCCNDRLVARQGDINAWSFAHESGADCAGGIETALHKAAIQIIVEEKALYIGESNPILDENPNFYQLLESIVSQNKRIAPFNEKRESTLNYFADDELVARVLSSQQQCLIPRLKFTGAVGEKQAEGSYRIPDVTCTFQGKPLYIEIVVTHECDQEKIDELKLLNVPTIEVHLSDLRRSSFKIEDIRDAILNGVNKNNLTGAVLRHWLVKPEYLRNAEKNAHEIIVAANAIIRDIANQRLEAERLREARKTRLNILGTKVNIDETDYGATVWIPSVSNKIYADVSDVMFKLKAIRRGNDWLLYGPKAKAILIAAFEKKEDEISREKAAIETQRQVELSRQEAERQANLIIAREKRAEEDKLREAAEAKQNELDMVLRAAERERLKEEARIKAENKAIADAKQKKDTAEIVARYIEIKDHRFKIKKINDDLKVLGYGQLTITDILQ